MLNILLAIVVGVGIGMQAAFLGGMRVSLGSPLTAAVINNSVGLLAMLAVWFALRPPLPDAAALAATPRLYYVAGALGALFVAAMAYLSPKLGVANAFLWILVGQLVTTAIIDHLGAFSMPVNTLSPARALGLVLVVAGSILVMRK